MSLINRCSMIIYPLPPFYEWQNELLPDNLLKIPDELLTKWFHVSFHTIVYDTLETPIKKEDDFDDEDYI
jgi:hypothetical protein